MASDKPSTNSRGFKIVQDSGVKKYMNNDGNFITGIDLSSEDLGKKRDQRLERFGHSPIKSATEVTFSLEKLQARAERFGRSAPVHNGEVIKTVNKLPAVPEGDIRSEAVLVHGTNEMNTKDILNYFAVYGPSYLEWINDASCNAVWEDPSSAHRALLGKGKFPVLTETELNPDDMDSINPIWRIGEPHPKAKQILLRHATTGDIKKQGAASRSVYYQKHGNPVMASSRQNTKRKGKLKKASWRENTDGVDNTNDTVASGEDLRSKLSSLRKMESTDDETKVKDSVPVEDEAKDSVVEDEAMEIGNEAMEIRNEPVEHGNGSNKDKPSSFIGKMRSDVMNTDFSQGQTDLRLKIASAQMKTDIKSRIG